jgi:hypothetical protein
VPSPSKSAGTAEMSSRTVSPSWSAHPGEERGEKV